VNDATCRSHPLLPGWTRRCAGGLRGLGAALGVAGLTLLAACAQQQQETAPQPETGQAEQPPQDTTQPPPRETVEQAIEAPEEIELQAPETPGPAHRVGLLLPLSGPRAELGADLLQAAQMALFEVAGEEFGLIVRDTKGTPDGAAAAAESAIGAGANLLLGPVFSSSVERVAPVARGGQVPVIAFTNDRTAARPGVYVTGLLPGQQVDRVVGYAAGQGLQSFAALVPDDAYGDLIRNALQRASETHGVRMVTSQSYPAGAQDISAAVQSLRQVRFDAVLLPEGGDRLRALAPTLPYYDIDPGDVQFLGTTQWNDPSLGRNPTLEGGWFAAPPRDNWERFAQRYREAYGDAPNRIAALSYDATALAALLARQAVRRDANPASVYTEQNLTQPSGFAGINGIFRLNPDGLVERRYAVLRLTAQGLEVLDPAPSSFAGATN
jgi:ABC-type branched-subunit amino acid transport system substrate-binding protein